MHLAPGEHYSGFSSLSARSKRRWSSRCFPVGEPHRRRRADDPSERDAAAPPWDDHCSISCAGRRAGHFCYCFGKRVTLAYDKEAEKWLGEIEVPISRKPRVHLRSTAASTGRRFHRTQSLPWIRSCRWSSCSFCRTTTLVGQTVTVRARFLVDVHPGDKITWEDGTQTVLGKPVSGRVFTFQKQLTLLPLHGLLLTPRGPIPIELL